DRRRPAALLDRIPAMRTLLVVLMLCLAVRAWADPFADGVVEATGGTGGGGGAQSNVLGPPHGAGPFQGSMHTFSLGLGGAIPGRVPHNAVVQPPGAGL